MICTTSCGVLMSPERPSMGSRAFKSNRGSPLDTAWGTGQHCSSYHVNTITSWDNVSINNKNNAENVVWEVLVSCVTFHTMIMSSSHFSWFFSFLIKPMKAIKQCSWLSFCNFSWAVERCDSWAKYPNSDQSKLWSVQGRVPQSPIRLIPD